MMVYSYEYIDMPGGLFLDVPHILDSAHER